MGAGASRRCMNLSAECAAANDEVSEGVKVAHGEHHAFKWQTKAVCEKRESRFARRNVN